MDHEPGRSLSRAALQAFWPNGRVGNRLQPLPELGCIYVKNPKAGCSTTLLWLHRAYTGDHGFLPAGGSIHAEHRLPTTRDVGWPETLRMLAGKAFRFTFVRDPIARAESAYVDKIVRAEGDRRWRRTQVQRALGLPEDPEQTVSFDQFVAALEAEDPLQMNPHWRPQHLNLMHGVVEYDLVGRLESYDADLARVREATGMPQAPVHVQNARPGGSRDSLFDGRPGLLRKAREVYARDLELYGY